MLIVNYLESVQDLLCNFLLSFLLDVNLSSILIKRCEGLPLRWLSLESIINIGTPFLCLLAMF